MMMMMREWSVKREWEGTNEERLTGEFCLQWLSDVGIVLDFDLNMFIFEVIHDWYY